MRAWRLSQTWCAAPPAPWAGPSAPGCPAHSDDCAPAQPAPLRRWGRADPAPPVSLLRRCRLGCVAHPRGRGGKLWRDDVQDCGRSAKVLYTHPTSGETRFEVVQTARAPPAPYINPPPRFVGRGEGEAITCITLTAAGMGPWATVGPICVTPVTGPARGCTLSHALE